MTENENAERWYSNPLVQGIVRACRKVEVFKDEVRRFYYAVLLSAHSCPVCGGSLRMTGPSECECKCGNKLDPTVAFQRSDCCGAPLLQMVLHYVCSECQRIVPSRFLFDERLFDPEYFREKMRESRERKRHRREELRLLLAGSRSAGLCLTDLPGLESIPGLEAALDGFIGTAGQISLTDFLGRGEFQMSRYREAILGVVPAGCSIRFSGIPPLCENPRHDRARRFITLLFMEQAREVEMSQCEDDILVERYEVDGEG
jgi:hypothetical protein